MQLQKSHLDKVTLYSLNTETCIIILPSILDIHTSLHIMAKLYPFVHLNLPEIYKDPQSNYNTAAFEITP